MFGCCAAADPWHGWVRGWLCSRHTGLTRGSSSAHGAGDACASPSTVNSTETLFPIQSLKTICKFQYLTRSVAQGIDMVNPSLLPKLSPTLAAAPRVPPHRLSRTSLTSRAGSSSRVSSAWEAGLGDGHHHHTCPKGLCANAFLLEGGDHLFHRNLKRASSW